MRKEVYRLDQLTASRRNQRSEIVGNPSDHELKESMFNSEEIIGWSEQDKCRLRYRSE